MTKTRYSKQRELIYENLKARCDHPTAETIYTELKKDNPGLSLGTVYRNLNFLAEAKLIRKLDVGQTTVHFDADLSAHHHFICKEPVQKFVKKQPEFYPTVFSLIQLFNSFILTNKSYRISTTV